MLKFMMLPNVEGFLALVRGSRGDVLLDLPDGTRCDLKRDHTAGQMLRAMEPGRGGISVRVSDPGDMPAFLRYMMEASL